MKNLIVLFLFLVGCFASAQESDEKEKVKALHTSTNLTWDANKALSEEKFVEAEVNYRKAISKSGENVAAPFNLGNAYYHKETYSEAFGRFKEAGELATDKKSKHKAYHNMGNVFMKRKEYQKAVEGYKEALRNDPTDEETRYNLALAKEMLKKEQDEQKNDENKDNEDKKDDKDKKDENKDKKEGDNGEKEDDEEQDKKDKGDKGDEEKEDNKEGDGDKKKEQDKKPEEGDKKEQPQQPRPNQLSKAASSKPVRGNAERREKSTTKNRRPKNEGCESKK